MTLTCGEQKLSAIVNLFSERQGLFKDIRINKLEKVPIAGTGAGRTIKLVRLVLHVNQNIEVLGI
jgi:hypothetical protein